MAKLVQMGKLMITANKKLKDAPGIRSKGFTLIELLIVIAVIGILAAALLIAIDPIDKIRAGNDTKVINDVRAIYDGANRAYTQTYTIPTDVTAIVTAGELKKAPAAPANYADYQYLTDTDNIVVYGQVMSKANIAKGGTGTGTTYFVASNSGGCYVRTIPTASFTCP